MAETNTRRFGLWLAVALLLLALLLTNLNQAATSRPVISGLVAAAPAPVAGAQISRAHIGLQVGHWRINELPSELARLRGATGGAGGGVREVDVNLAVAQRVADHLRAAGHSVELLPATVPPGYQADLFLAIHADAVLSPNSRGYKLARSRFSRLPTTDDLLVRTISEEYGRATGLPWSPAITRNMTGYYAFNHVRLRHAISYTTPAAIIEMGYVTNAADRALLTAGNARVVDGIVRGITRFLSLVPTGDQREQPIAPPPADCRHFSQTDQEICGPFRRAWESRGGLTHFGLPLSPELSETNPATGRERLVQYFERARFEYASESGEVQLGLLGRLVAAERRSETPFQPVADPRDGTWFPETGHTLHHGFRAYWEANGGLAAFGFPISQEFLEPNADDGHTYIVQYFERARFEYHPAQRGTPYEIQRGQLGRLFNRTRG